MSSSPSQRLAHAARLLSSPIRLVDGPLYSIRDQLIERMAADLVEADAFNSEDDAVMLLRFKGYSPINVCLLAGAAVCVAQQTVVAEVMSGS